jgi:mono/diheme cytochrome c family protein
MRLLSSFLLGVFVLAAGPAFPQAVTPKGGNPEAAKEKNPVPANGASLTRGKTLYQARCSSCHGADGHGGGGTGEGGPPSPDLTRAHFTYGDSNGEVFEILENGVLPDLYMPTFGGDISDQDLWNIVNYVQSLRKK